MEKGIHLTLLDLVYDQSYEVEFSLELSLLENFDLLKKLAKIKRPLIVFYRDSPLIMTLPLKQLRLFDHSCLSFF